MKGRERERRWGEMKRYVRQENPEAGHFLITLYRCPEKHRYKRFGVMETTIHNRIWLLVLVLVLVLFFFLVPLTLSSKRTQTFWLWVIA